MKLTKFVREYEEQICIKDSVGKIHEFLPKLTSNLFDSDDSPEQSLKIYLSQMSCPS